MADVERMKQLEQKKKDKDAELFPGSSQNDPERAKMYRSLSSAAGKKLADDPEEAGRRRRDAQTGDAEDPKQERAMRDRMNGIVRNQEGEIISIRGKSVRPKGEKGPDVSKAEFHAYGRPENA
jgi:hypothetical protein